MYFHYFPTFSLYFTCNFIHYIIYKQLSLFFSHIKIKILKKIINIKKGVMKKDILIILDASQLNIKTFVILKYAIIDMFDDYNIVFKIFDKDKKEYKLHQELIQCDIDEDSKDIQKLNYECIIVCGEAAYYWLKSYYCKAMIVINPILEIEEDYDDFRRINAEKSICILSSEMAGQIQKFDNQFENTTVVLANESIRNVSKFWSKKSYLYQIFNFIINE